MPTACLMAFLGAVLLWVAMSPLDLWPLAWIAPVPWVWLIRRTQLIGQEERRPAGCQVATGGRLARALRRCRLVFWEVVHDRRPYLTLTVAGFAFWMGALHWLRLPDPATSIGWVALSFYFAFYLPAFVGLSRAAVHRLHIPVMLAAPMVWTGLELARGHLLSGMTMGSLCHTQYRWTQLIQISDLAGGYGVSFVMMLVAAALASVAPEKSSMPTQRPAFQRALAVAWPLLLAVAVMTAVLLYGRMRMAENLDAPGPRIALIQGSIDIDMRYDSQRRSQVFRQYFELSRAAVEKYHHVDLLVWPETMFLEPIVTFDPRARRPAEFQGSESEFQQWLPMIAKRNASLMAETARRIGVPLLLGVDTNHFGVEGPRCYNSAAYLDREGRLLGRYDKMHLVPFGEYVPFADRFPWLQRLTPLPISVTAGDKPMAIEIRMGERGSLCRIAPNICYETVLPHVIRRQVNELSAVGREPDVLMNLTNDGWFWGSSELDMHLACSVFRAVECRKPLLVAANTGFSAWLASDGTICRQGPRRDTGVILAEPRLDRRHSWYL
ncbi:MAG: apolipoprotein N-acyltransferase, partial [Planctomycetaceae bacterium]|nr:apolipoprotein N-acyltransferase [Planctomycetaceae bacterium]